MKRLAVALMVLTLFAGLFFVGLFSAATGALIAGFCGSPFALVYVGWTLGRSGIRISVGYAGDVAVAPSRAAHNADSHSVQRVHRLQR